MTNSLKYDEIKLRVRYGETDQMGVVYHGNYAQYFEVGRVEWLRKLGMSYKEREATGIMLRAVIALLHQWPAAQQMAQQCMVVK